MGILHAPQILQLIGWGGTIVMVCHSLTCGWSTAQKRSVQEFIKLEHKKYNMATSRPLPITRTSTLIITDGTDIAETGDKFYR